MKRLTTVADFKQYLLETYSLEKRDLESLMDEIISFYDLEAKEFIRIRHQELKQEGMLNEAAFNQIKSELDQRRFKSEDLSLRQIRRIIYG